MGQRDHERLMPCPVISLQYFILMLHMESYAYDAHTQFGCYAFPLPRASGLMLPSCSTVLNSSVKPLSAPQSKPDNKLYQKLALLAPVFTAYFFYILSPDSAKYLQSLFSIIRFLAQSLRWQRYIST